MHNLVFEQHFSRHSFKQSLMDVFIVPQSCKVELKVNLVRLFWQALMRHEDKLFELVGRSLQHWARQLFNKDAFSENAKHLLLYLFHAQIHPEDCLFKQAEFDGHELLQVIR